MFALTIAEKARLFYSIEIAVDALAFKEIIQGGGDLSGKFFLKLSIGEALSLTGIGEESQFYERGGNLRVGENLKIGEAMGFS